MPDDSSSNHSNLVSGFCFSPPQTTSRFTRLRYGVLSARFYPILLGVFDYYSLSSLVLSPLALSILPSLDHSLLSSLLWKHETRPWQNEVLKSRGTREHHVEWTYIGVNFCLFDILWEDKMPHQESRSCNSQPRFPRWHRCTHFSELEI